MPPILHAFFGNPPKDISHTSKHSSPPQSDFEITARQVFDNSERIISKRQEHVRRILIVDNDPQSLHSLSRRLEEKGFEISTSTNALQALSLLKETDVDLVITDAAMPMRSGIDLLKDISTQMPYIPVIVTTRHPEESEAAECIHLGAIDYIGKPLDPREIERAIQAGMQRTAPRYEPQKNEVIADYKVLRFLGEGSIGKVWLVSKNGRRYAIKLLKDINLPDGKLRFALNRFIQEAKAAMMVHHPNVISVYDFGFIESHSIPYIILEYLDGTSLRSQISGGAPLDHRTKAAILLQVANALEAIHQQGVVHRDIKPENIILSKNLNVTLTDFGLAHLPGSQLTQTENIFGTPAYMSPESLRRATCDHRSDIFSFGSTAYEFFTGKLPFEGETIYELVMLISAGRPTAPCRLVPDLPAPIQSIMSRMLGKDVEDRYQSAGEIAADLHAYLTNLPISSETVLMPEVWDPPRNIKAVANRRQNDDNTNSNSPESKEQIS